jgi:zinc and cadmium transporter
MALQARACRGKLMLPFTAGVFIYIAGSDLLPELQKEHNPSKSGLQLVAMIFGVGFMYLLRVIG